MTPGVSYFAIIHLFLFIDKYYLAVYTPLVMDGIPLRKLYREGPETDKGKEPRHLLRKEVID